jgi:hypothetical protein
MTFKDWATVTAAVLPPLLTGGIAATRIALEGRKARHDFNAQRRNLVADARDQIASVQFLASLRANQDANWSDVRDHARKIVNAALQSIDHAQAMSPPPNRYIVRDVFLLYPFKTKAGKILRAVYYACLVWTSILAYDLFQSQKEVNQLKQFVQQLPPDERRFFPLPQYSVEEYIKFALILLVIGALPALAARRMAVSLEETSIDRAQAMRYILRDLFVLYPFKTRSAKILRVVYYVCLVWTGFVVYMLIQVRYLDKAATIFETALISLVIGVLPTLVARFAAVSLETRKSNAIASQSPSQAWVQTSEDRHETAISSATSPADRDIDQDIKSIPDAPLEAVERRPDAEAPSVGTGQAAATSAIT